MTGLQITVIGFGIVMLALIVLYFVIVGLSRFLNPGSVAVLDLPCTIKEKEIEPKEAESELKKSGSAPVEREQLGMDDLEKNGKKKGEEVKDEIDPEVVAAISASIFMLLQSEPGEKGFRIRSIKPIKRDKELTSWTMSGREELMKPHETI